MYTYKVEQAIKAATLLHQDHVRQGQIPLPYVTHLVATMMIVRDYTSDENTLVAALLHDALEDTDYTKEEMKMVWETKKIFNDDTIVVNPTAVRVPVLYGHSEAVHIETKKKITATADAQIFGQCLRPLRTDSF